MLQIHRLCQTLSVSVLLVFISLTATASNKSFFDLTAKGTDGKTVALSQYKGKVLLVVNTASQCGYTPQLSSLEKIYQKYGKKGFSVLAFPSNDFRQEPGSSAEVASFAQKEYQTTFPFFEKAAITGASKQPVYAFLTAAPTANLFKDIQWNFEKFLIGKNGQVLGRWPSSTAPDSAEVIKAVESALSEKIVSK